MTHMYFSARAEGRISYGHLGRRNLFTKLICMVILQFCNKHAYYFGIHAMVSHLIDQLLGSTA